MREFLQKKETYDVIARVIEKVHFIKYANNMFSPTLLSKISQLTLLSVFCTGLFVTSGEISMNNDMVQIGNGGIYSAIAQEGGPKAG